MRRPHFSNAGRLDPANPSLTLPVRAAFYYGWYPYSWDQLGYTPFTRYTPTLGAYYDTGAPATVAQHLAWMRSANIDAAICSWWGASHANATHAHLLTMLDIALQHGMKACVYHEGEGSANPTVASIQSDLADLAVAMAHPAYLHVAGKPVIFVYSANDTSAGDLTTRWSSATSGYTTHYVSLKTFTGALSEPDQPQSWHEYGPANRVARVTGKSYNISPGFWRIDEANPRLTRSLATWQTNIADMVASGDEWHLITSFNEWGEGTQIEPSTQLGTAYLDALA